MRVTEQRRAESEHAADVRQHTCTSRVIERTTRHAVECDVAAILRRDADCLSSIELRHLAARLEEVDG